MLFLPQVSIRKIVLSFIFLFVIIFSVIYFLLKSRGQKENLRYVSPTPSVIQQMEEKFKGVTIPQDDTKIELKNISGEEGMGIATKTEVLADLPELTKGGFYQVLLSNGNKTIFLGNLKESKGGWILEYDLSKYQGYNQLIVSKGSKEILKGSF